MIRCLVPACGRSLKGDAKARICPSCWRFVSPAARLALADHGRVAAWKGTLSGLEHWLFRDDGGRSFLDWSWRVTFALAAWEAAHERRWRRMVDYEPHSEPAPPAGEAILSNLLRKMA